MIDNKLQTLIQVAETGSYTKAALALSLSQPAVSQHIKQLEAELKIRLFNRGNGAIKLTKEGEIALKYAKRIQNLYQGLEQALLDAKHQATRLFVGITHTSESNILAEVLASYANEHPGVSIKIFSDSITNLNAMLKTFEIDMAIVDGNIIDTDFNSVLLDTDSLVLAMSNHNPLAKKSMVCLDELKREKLILRLPNSGTRNLFISHLHSNNLSLEEFNVILEIDNVATIKDLIRRDFGVSILPKSACMDELRKGKMTALPVENLSMIREVKLLYHKDFQHPEIVDGITKLYYSMVEK